MQNAYTSNIKKVGVGVGVITFLSIASVSSNTGNSNMTLTTSNGYAYEAADIINDNKGEVCISTNLSNQVVGDLIAGNKEKMEDLSRSNEAKNVKIHITEVSKHISKFDFEEEYEEL